MVKRRSLGKFRIGYANLEFTLNVNDFLHLMDAARRNVINNFRLLLRELFPNFIFKKMSLKEDLEKNLAIEFNEVFR